MNSKITFNQCNSMVEQKINFIYGENCRKYFCLASLFDSVYFTFFDRRTHAQNTPKDYHTQETREEKTKCTKPTNRKRILCIHFLLSTHNTQCQLYGACIRCLYVCVSVCTLFEPFVDVAQFSLLFIRHRDI